MIGLVQLNNRKKSIESFLRSNEAMKAISAIMINRSKKNLAYLLAFKDFFKLEDKNETSKIFHLIIGVNNGMCGDFFNIILNYSKNLLKKKEHVLFLGDKFKNYGLDKFDFIRLKKIILTKKESILLACEILKIMKLNQLNTVILHFYSDMKINKVKFYFNSNEINHSFTLLLAIEIFKALNSSALCENKERIMNLEQSKKNADEMYKNIKNNINKLRQENITNDLNELITGAFL